MTVRVINKDLSDVTSGVVNEKCLEPPAAAAKAGRGSWGRTLANQISMMKAHVHVGVTGFGLGEALLGVEGRVLVGGVRIGKLEGSLKDQIQVVKSADSKTLDEILDFAFEYESATKKAENQILLVPPGYILTMCSPHYIGVHWSFGMCAEHLPKVKETLAMLFESWPTVRSGEYEAFDVYVNKS